MFFQQLLTFLFFLDMSQREWRDVGSSISWLVYFALCWKKMSCCTEEWNSLFKTRRAPFSPLAEVQQNDFKILEILDWHDAEFIQYSTFASCQKMPTQLNSCEFSLFHKTSRVSKLNDTASLVYKLTNWQNSSNVFHFFILSAQMDKANKLFSNNNSENVT